MTITEKVHAANPEHAAIAQGQVKLREARKAREQAKRPENINATMLADLAQAGESIPNDFQDANRRIEQWAVDNQRERTTIRNAEKTLDARLKASVATHADAMLAVLSCELDRIVQAVRDGTAANPEQLTHEMNEIWKLQDEVYHAAIVGNAGSLTIADLRRVSRWRNALEVHTHWKAARTRAATSTDASSAGVDAYATWLGHLAPQTLTVPFGRFPLGDVEALTAACTIGNPWVPSIAEVQRTHSAAGFVRVVDETTLYRAQESRDSYFEVTDSEPSTTYKNVEAKPPRRKTTHGSNRRVTV